MHLRLYSNQLSGTISTFIGNLEKLRNCKNGNKFTSIHIRFSIFSPHFVFIVFRILVLLYNNNLRGTIPSEIGNFNLLGSFWLSENNLAGSIPPEKKDMNDLEKLQLNDNLAAV